MIRSLLSVALVSMVCVCGAVPAAFAAEESSSERWNNPQPDPRYYPRPYNNPYSNPYDRPPPRYREEPRVRLGDVCRVRRYDCSLYRPRPVGTDCECRLPSGEVRSGTVR